MNEEQNKLLEAAINALRIRDVMLNEATFKRPTEPPANTDTVQVKQLANFEVRYIIGNVPSEDGEPATKLLQVLVSLGTKIVGDDTSVANQATYFEIGATFLVEYAVESELSDAALKLFAEHNSVYNCWPFWRQHVFDIVSRARLPHIDVPLFRAMRPPRKSSVASVSGELPKPN